MKFFKLLKILKPKTWANVLILGFILTCFLLGFGYILGAIGENVFLVLGRLICHVLMASIIGIFIGIGIWRCIDAVKVIKVDVKEKWRRLR